MRALLTSVSVAVCLFALASLSFAAPASEKHDIKKFVKPAKCEKGQQYYKDGRGKLVKCHIEKDAKKDVHPREFDGRSSATSFSSVNITDVGNGTEIDSKGNYQEGDSGSFQYNETARLGGPFFDPEKGDSTLNRDLDNIIVYDNGGRSRPGLRYGNVSFCKMATTVIGGTSAATITTTSTILPTTTPGPSDDGGDDLLHLTAIVNALPTEALDGIL